MATNPTDEKLPIVKPPLVAGGKISAIIPTDIDQAYRLATIIASANMAPKSYNRAADAIMVAIIHGSEVGLPPMAALQSIAVINGMPTIWGDGALGLVRSSGLLEDISETIEGEGESMVATCVAKRAGQATPIMGRFSVLDAKKASLWNKQGPWNQYPKRMLQMRARSFCLRDGFADVLRGLRFTEEVRDMGELAPDDAGDYRPIPPRPKRADFEQEVMPNNSAPSSRQYGSDNAPPPQVVGADLDAQYAATMSGRMPDEPEPNNDADGVVADPPSTATVAWSVDVVKFPSAKPTPKEVQEWCASVTNHLRFAPNADLLAVFLSNNAKGITWVRNRYATDGDALGESIAEAQARCSP